MSSHKENARTTVTTTVSVLINGSATSTSTGDLSGMTAVGVYAPASISGTSITFTASYDGVTFVPVYDGLGAALSLTIASSEYIPFDPAKFAGIRYLKIVSSATETSKTFVIVTRPIL